MNEYTPDPWLTEEQNELYKYLLAGKPLISQRQLARDIGLGENPQRLFNAVTVLLMRGKLVPVDKQDYER